MCQQGADYVELFIYLGEPCQVCQLLLTVSHGVQDSSYPATVDVRLGSSIDALKLVVEVLVFYLFSLVYYHFFYFLAPAISSNFLLQIKLFHIFFSIWLDKLSPLYPKSRLQTQKWQSLLKFEYLMCHQNLDLRHLAIFAIPTIWTMAWHFCMVQN